MNRTTTLILTAALLVLGIGVTIFIMMAGNNDDSSLTLDQDPADKPPTNANASNNRASSRSGRKTTATPNQSLPDNPTGRDNPDSAAMTAALLITGRVLDGRYHGVVDATVEAAGRSTQTKDDGSFALEVTDVATGQLTITASKEGTSRSRDLKVERGTKLLNATLMLFAGGTISGQVLTKGSGQPIENARVTLRYRGVGVDLDEFRRGGLPAPPEGFGNMPKRTLNAGPDDDYEVLRHVVTGPQGSFSFDDLRPGQYVLRADRGMVTDEPDPDALDRQRETAVYREEEMTSEVPVSSSGGREEESSRTSLQLQEGERQQRNLYVPLPRFVRFTIANANPGEVQVNLLEAIYFDDRSGRSMSPQSTSLMVPRGKDGVYAVAGLDPLHAGIWIKPANYAPLKRSFRVPPSGDLDLGPLTFESGSAIIGRTVDGQGQGVADVGIRLGKPQSFDASADDDPAEVFAATSDAKGDFRIDGIEAGGYMVLGVKAGLVGQPQTITVEEGKVTRIEVIIQVPGSIAGTITRPEVPAVPDESSDPSRNWVVVTATPKDQFEAFAEQPAARLAEYADGQLNSVRIEDGTDNYLLTGIVPGEYVVQAFWDGFTSNPVAVTVRSAEQVRADITFPKPASLYGQIIGEDGSPLAKTRVSIANQLLDFRNRLTTRTDDAGQYRIETVPPGSYLVRLDVDNNRFDSAFMRERSVTLSDGEDKEFNIDLSRASGAVLRGKVTISNNANVRELTLVRVGMRALDGRQVRMKEGNFEVTGLDEGPYYLYFEGGGLRWRDHVVIRSGENVFERNYRVHRISGQVQAVGASEPTANAGITVTARALLSDVIGPDKVSGFFPPYSAKADATGQYVFNAVIEGEYELSASHPDYATVIHKVQVTSDAVQHFTLTTGGAKISVVIDSFEGGASASGDFTDLLSNGGEIRFIGSDGRIAPRTGENREPFDMLSVGSTITRGQLEAGSYTISVVGWAAEPWSTTVTVAAGEEKTVHAKLRKAARIRLKVANEGFDTALLAQATLSVVNAADGKPAPAASGVDDLMDLLSGGAFLGFQQGGLTAGVWRFSISVPGYRPFSREFTVTQGKNITEDITLAKG